MPSVIMAENIPKCVDSVQRDDLERVTNLTCTTENMLIVWEDKKKSLIVMELNDDNTVSKKKVISLTNSPSFTVTALSLTAHSKYLLLWGPHGVMVVEMPLIWDRIFLDDSSRSPPPFESTDIGARIFLNLSIVILKARWHPSSNHVAVLTNDNLLRIFDIQRPFVEKEQIDFLSSGVLNSSASAGLKICDAIGENIVDFDFGPPLNKSKKCAHIAELSIVCPIFALTASIDVYVVYFSLNDEFISQRVFGPLSIKRFSDDEYEFDACSIMCVDYEMSLLVIATFSGRVYHLLALEEDAVEESSFEFSVGSETRVRIPPMALYLTDQMVIDFTVMNSKRSLETTKLSLVPHLFDPRCYFIVHSFGVHKVHISFLDQLLNKSDLDDLQPEPSDIQCLLWTATSQSQTSLSPVGYGALMKSGVTLAVMLSDGQFVFKIVGSLNVPKSVLSSTDRADGDQVPTKPSSNDCDFLNKFEVTVRRLTSIPTMVAGDSKAELTQTDLEQFQVMINHIKKEYFEKLTKASILIQTKNQNIQSNVKRIIDTHENLKHTLQNECKTFDTLVKKWDDVDEKNQELDARANNLLSILMSRSTSQYEDQYLVENLQEYQKKVDAQYEKMDYLKRVFEMQQSQMNRLKFDIKKNKINSFKSDLHDIKQKLARQDAELNKLVEDATMVGIIQERQN